MNRIIKFRAWDKEERYLLKEKKGVMLYPSKSGFIEKRFGMNQEETYYLGFDGVVVTREWNGVSDEYDEFDKKEMELVLMQFTGLLDRHGKEIYEGDIVKRSTNIFVIEWQQIGEERSIGIGFNIHEPEARICEILGNIYENPNLLEPNNK